MNFFSFEFLIGFSIFLFIYWVISNDTKDRNIILTAASYGLVASFSTQAVIVLLSYTAFIYILSLASYKFLIKKAVYTLLILAIVLLLFFFKYYTFAQESIQSVLSNFGIDYNIPALDLLLPVGLSYYCFHSVSYISSIVEKRINKPSLIDTALYLSFFPSIISGPINRAEQLLPQIQNPERTLLAPQRAFFLIALAITKLFLFSAILSSKIVDPVFNDPAGFTPTQNILAVYAYAWNIYCNFSGYTNLVTGIAMLLGIQVPENFNAPYLAKNLKEFWQRWHISLSRFIRDYIYIPLGGNQKGFTNTCFNLMFAMVVSGLWHGAATTYLIWGAIHGLGVIAHNVQNKIFPNNQQQHPPNFLLSQIAQLLCFHYVCLGWVFFRSESPDTAIVMLKTICTLKVSDLSSTEIESLLTANGIVLLYPLWNKIRGSIESFSEKMNWLSFLLWLTLTLTAVFALSPPGIPNFIYASF